jgi:RNA polymerase sigma-70 factor (ECF subfamily)
VERRQSGRRSDLRRRRQRPGAAGPAAPPWCIVAAVSSDTELLYAWRAGDGLAGQQLFKRYYTPIARFFSNKINDPPGDLVQETFTACVKGRDRIREGGSFRGYLFGVAYNVLTGYLRRRYAKHEDLGSMSILDLDPSPSVVMHRSEEVRLLLQALRTLPIELQVVVELRYWEQMNSSEIGRVLGIPAATIRSRLQKGHALLEAALRKLPASKEVLESTLGDLDGWAQKVREGVQQAGA